MSPAATEARRLALIRLNHAAGAAFGWDDDAAAARPARIAARPAALALVTLATALAAITYLV